MRRLVLPAVGGAMLALLTHGTRSLQAASDAGSVLDNGRVRLAVDLTIGGAITYLSRSGTTENVINSHDWGRQVQQSYYSGPRPFGTPHPGWKDWPWNPISSGDVYGHRSRVVEHHNDGRTLYVKSVPMQWALDGVPGDCTFEEWIRLSGSAVQVRTRLTNQRADHTQYRAMDQELPAVYTTGKLHRVVTYDGFAPWSDGVSRQVRNSGPPWESWRATEHWAALLDDHDWGLGVIHPSALHFIGGFHGKPGAGGPLDDATGYLAPVHLDLLDHNIQYENQYALLLGSLEEIRRYAAAHRPDERPDFRFSKNRQHWTYVHANDTGWPVTHGLQMILAEDDPQLHSPEVFFHAADVPKLYLRAAFHTGGKTAELYWKSVEQPDYSPARRLSFPVTADDQLRTYTLDLAAHSSYRGIITGLRLDPEPSGSPGDSARIESLSWRR